ncbi:N,N-dimethylformamidase beta subunit family domain-containing protein [Mesorhizobium sp.]|uniref:N,N-dimethylformamidase beta subunit family domain-containing protein n=1 Tax=Mesorhizobium sp. TaxID=1871066 RepID=UPI0025F1B396|nr:N,N-dimethylformamidase beta subunit family domain-containing protein [Mesorhizobium sp.]
MPGSYGTIPLVGLDISVPLTFVVRFQPRLIKDQPQCLFSLVGDSKEIVSFDLDTRGLSLTWAGARTELDLVPQVGTWYELRLAGFGGPLQVACYALPAGARVAAATIKVAGSLSGVRELVLAARRSPAEGSPTIDFFNGRLENPSFLVDERIPETLGHDSPGKSAAFWDFSVAISGKQVKDSGPSGLHGELINLPARGVRGSRWSGREMSWAHAPEEYSAIHFHEGDFYDCGWETDFIFEVPHDLPSGVYGIRLRCGHEQDVIPVFVRPKLSGRTAKLAVLFSTLTYQAYCNYPRTNYGDAYRARQEAWGSNPHHPARYPQFGHSLYDVHADGSGVMFSSLRRPQLLMRPGLFAYLDQAGSGLRHFPADMHLIAWLNAKGIAADVVTDHDLEVEGSSAIKDYAVLLTVTHPEYHTLGSLNALEEFIGGGGSMAYLGGNGFYWRVATSAEYPDAIEIRRGESGVRMWEAETGECYHAFDGQYGGLWLKNGRPPQRLVGIGMSAHGGFSSTHYRRTETSRSPEFAWLFDGVDEEILGDFGYSGGAAAGFELDTVDASLGTAESAVVLAVSEGHPDDYSCVPEKIWNPDVHTNEWQRQQIRADLTLVPGNMDNLVLSTGSIMFCGSLPYNGFNNNISRLLHNFVVRCLAEAT